MCNRIIATKSGWELTHSHNDSLYPFKPEIYIVILMFVNCVNMVTRGKFDSRKFEKSLSSCSFPFLFIFPINNFKFWYLMVIFDLTAVPNQYNELRRTVILFFKFIHIFFKQINVRWKSYLLLYQQTDSLTQTDPLEGVHLWYLVRYRFTWPHHHKLKFYYYIVNTHKWNTPRKHPFCRSSIYSRRLSHFTTHQFDEFGLIILYALWASTSPCKPSYTLERIYKYKSQGAWRKMLVMYLDIYSETWGVTDRPEKHSLFLFFFLFFFW